ncbi:MauE/DoxX family redox-associated membrane protein [Plantactinospora soyae]|uniref:Methylamine utilisation protein MauE domain-containing protein n=1 Tax=Plantactinospora soyae TaxID=1544732 RepID=A0A927MG40_9ACTN|nr:MauE/DoxX family redox-associated membrane protein [Plantactinospora soyae]MBE1491063.1 hypothetical protein [Plantactinospora soyae]
MIEFVVVLAAGARFAVGFTLLASGAAKARDPVGFIRGVRDYRLVPDRLGPVVAVGVLCAELVVGMALLAGMMLAWAAAGAVALGLVFTAAIAVNLRRRRPLPCYCFGPGESISARSLVRAAALVIAAAAVLSAGWTGADLTAPTLPATLLQATVGLGLLAIMSWLLVLPELRSLRAAPGPLATAAASSSESPR